MYFRDPKIELFYKFVKYTFMTSSCISSRIIQRFGCVNIELGINTSDIHLIQISRPELLPPGHTSYQESVKKVLTSKCPKFLRKFDPKPPTNFLIIEMCNFFSDKNNGYLKVWWNKYRIQGFKDSTRIFVLHIIQQSKIK